MQNTEAFVKARLLSENTGHDWWHAVRVSSMAKHINESENGDSYIIDLACLLHDVGDRKVITEYDDDSSIAENFLLEQSVPEHTIKQVMYIINNMSFSKNLKNKLVNAPLELLVVQDADRLDAIGAIGIARMFAYGGSNGRLIFDPTEVARDVKTTKQYKQPSGSSFHHFEEKLLHIKDLLNTKSAKDVAEGRDAFMRTYMEQFTNEWNGLK